MTSQDGLYGLGYTCVTKIVTKRSEIVRLSQSEKSYRSTDCSLKLGDMKLESQVIV